jgi:hypothetical protein
MLNPDGSKATPLPVPVGNVAGSAYLVPKPLDQGYTEIKGVVACATAKVLKDLKAAAMIPISGI